MSDSTIRKISPLKCHHKRTWRQFYWLEVHGSTQGDHTPHTFAVLDCFSLFCRNQNSAQCPRTLYIHQQGCAHVCMITLWTRLPRLTLFRRDCSLIVVCTLQISQHVHVLKLSLFDTPTNWEFEHVFSYSDRYRYLQCYMCLAKRCRVSHAGAFVR